MLNESEIYQFVMKRLDSALDRNADFSARSDDFEIRLTRATQSGENNGAILSEFYPFSNPFPNIRQ